MEWYFRPYKVEKNGLIYDKLGIKTFLKLTPFEIASKIRKKKTTVIKNKKDLKKYYKDTKNGELAHLISFLVILIASILSIFKENYFISIILFFLNILVNLYPIFLMRYNRFRISRILKKKI